MAEPINIATTPPGPVLASCALLAILVEAWLLFAVLELVVVLLVVDEVDELIGVEVVLFELFAFCDELFDLAMDCDALEPTLLAADLCDGFDDEVFDFLLEAL